MKDDWRREVEEELYVLDEQDQALLEHIFGEDSLPQGLHQGRREPKRSEPEDWEPQAVSDYLYPWWLEDGYE